MKYRLTAAEYAALTDEMKASYGPPSAEGLHTLKLEGLDVAAITAKVDEFRTNNIALERRAAAAEARLQALGNIDPAAAAAAVAELAKLKDKTGAGGADDVQTAIQRAVESAVKPLTDQVTALTQREKDALEQAAKAQFLSTFDQVALDAGIRRKSLIDARARAEAAGFKLVNGRLVQMNGTAPVFRDGVEVDAKTWLTSTLRTEADHLFEPNTGADANGSGPGPQAQRTLANPSALDMGMNLADIASGKVAVTIDGL